MIFAQLRKRFTEQVKMEEARFRQWGAFTALLSPRTGLRDSSRGVAVISGVSLTRARSPTAEQHLIAERDRLNKDLEQAHRCAALSLRPCITASLHRY